MNDTNEATRKKMVEMVRQKSGVELLKMGASMFDVAKKLVLASLQSQNVKERRVQLFLRFYDNDFNDKAKQKIIQYLERHS